MCYKCHGGDRFCYRLFDNNVKNRSNIQSVCDLAVKMGFAQVLSHIQASAACCVQAEREILLSCVNASAIFYFQ